MKPVFLFGGLLLGLGLVFFLSISVIPKALVTLTKASGSGRVVVATSYLLGEKILAKADGKDDCRLNVFLLDKNGRGVSGKTAELTGIEGITKINSLSNSNGKVAFKVISNIEGQFELKASIDGVELPQTVTVTFRK